MSISAIIPTRNRLESLRRTLQCMQRQTMTPAEVWIVDSSDEVLPIDALRAEFALLPLQCVRTEASVCMQRNTGIRRSASDWIFLCDDDMEFGPDYLETLLAFAAKEKAGAVSGLWMQMENGEWQSQYPVVKMRALLWAYFFQLSVWGEIVQAKKRGLAGWLHGSIKKFYERRQNSVSLGGWPLLTSQEAPYFRTQVYSLGASLVKKDWLVRSPFDEVLDPSGIGDNYGVEMGFPERGIFVLTSAFAYHHRSPVNRLATVVSYYRRILALHYFITSKSKSGGLSVSRGWFAWSLIGLVILHLKKGNRNMAHATVKALFLTSIGGNPYHQGRKKNKRVVQPFI